MPPPSFVCTPAKLEIRGRRWRGRQRPTLPAPSRFSARDASADTTDDAGVVRMFVLATPTGRQRGRESRSDYVVVPVAMAGTFRFGLHP